MSRAPRPGSASRRRSLLDAVDADEPTLWLQLACGARVPAHRELLQFVSSCVKGLPPGELKQLKQLLPGCCELKQLGAQTSRRSGATAPARPAPRPQRLSICRQAHQGAAHGQPRLRGRAAQRASATNLCAGDTWDLSDVLIDGQPVARPVVVAWVEVVYNGG